MTEIEQWLKSGAGVQEGLRLLSVYKPNPWLVRMVERHPEKYRRLLVETLTGVKRSTVVETAVRSRSLREDWPFLSKPDCPPELKILAADKITAWRGYVQEHEKLYACITLEDCLETAKKCIFFYSQNRKILSEFAYYKEHGTVLGKHPVFEEMNHRRSSCPWAYSVSSDAGATCVMPSGDWASSCAPETARTSHPGERLSWKRRSGN